MTIPTAKQSSLVHRLIVIAIGLPLLWWLILMGGRPYAALIGAVVILGVREYLKMLKAANFMPRPIPAYLASTAIVYAMANHAGLMGLLSMEGTLGEHFLIIIFVTLFVVQISDVLIITKTSWINMALTLLGVIWIGGFGGSFILVRSFDYVGRGGESLAFSLTMALFVTVWICDSLAYIFGRAFGKTKIWPEVSPNKTVVGTVAGAIGAVVVMVLSGVAGWIPLTVFSYFDLVIFGLIVGVLGQMGDFVQSRLKRDYGVKDSGNLLPGHGGILDRFDSLFYVMPAVYLYLLLII